MEEPEKWSSPVFGSHKYLAPCGTLAAYMRHLRRGEPRDFKCRVANVKESQKKRDRRKQK